MIKFPLPEEHLLPHEIKLVPPFGTSNGDPCLKKVIGSFVGLAVGDALGASVEFRPYQYIADHPVRDMDGGGTWGLKPGQWTDDTSMALCLASSLISKHGFDPYDQMVRYKWWFKDGYMSSTGECFDIGHTTRESLERFINLQQILSEAFNCRKKQDVDFLSWSQVQTVKGFDINCGSVDAAGNGALMRLAAVPLFFHRSPATAVKYAGYSARLTHGNQIAIDACRYYAALIVAAITTKSKDDLLKNDFYENHREWFGSSGLHKEILDVVRGSYKLELGYEAGIRGKGYVVNALEAALWAFWSDEGSFEKGVLKAINLGDDTDTTAAIYGQLAGAFYGYENIPKRWIDQVYAHDLLYCVAQWLFFEGKQYNAIEKQQKSSSTMYAPDIALEKTQQPTIRRTPTRDENMNPLGVRPLVDKYQPDSRLNSKDLPSSLRDHNRSQIHRQDDTKTSSYRTDVYRWVHNYPDVNRSYAYNRDANILPNNQSKRYQSAESTELLDSFRTRKPYTTTQWSTVRKSNYAMPAYNVDFGYSRGWTSGYNNLSNDRSYAHYRSPYDPYFDRVRIHRLDANPSSVGRSVGTSGRARSVGPTLDLDRRINDSYIRDRITPVSSILRSLSI